MEYFITGIICGIVIGGCLFYVAVLVLSREARDEMDRLLERDDYNQRFEQPTAAGPTGGEAYPVWHGE